MDLTKKLSNKETPVGDVSHTGYSLTTIKIREGTVDELERILEQKIDKAHGAYRNAPVIVNVEDVGNLNSFDFFKLQEVCKQHELFLIGVTGVVNEDRADALVRRRIPVVNSNRYARIREENIKPKIVTQFLELKVPVPVEVPYEVRVPVEVNVPAPVKVMCGLLRTGQKILAPNSSVAFYGNTSDSSRVIASHHVFVFGDVNGAELFAGAPKNESNQGLEDSIIHVQGSFNPKLIGIAGSYCSAEDLDNNADFDRVRRQNNGAVVTLEGNRLKFYTIHEFATINKTLR